MKDITEMIPVWENPWTKNGVTDDKFIPVEELVGKKIVITDAILFTNDSGEGAYMLLHVGDDSEYRYTCTHSIGLCAPFKDEAVLEALPLTATITKRKSKTSDHTVYAFEAPKPESPKRDCLEGPSAPIA